MTLPDERTRAVLHAGEFLLKLCIPAETPKVPKKIRKIARMILRHYPSSFEMERAAEQAPQIFGVESSNEKRKA